MKSRQVRVGQGEGLGEVVGGEDPGVSALEKCEQASSKNSEWPVSLAQERNERSPYLGAVQRGCRQEDNGFPFHIHI